MPVNIYICHKIVTVWSLSVYIDVMVLICQNGYYLRYSHSHAQCMYFYLAEKTSLLRVDKKSMDVDIAPAFGKIIT